MGSVREGREGYRVNRPRVCNAKLQTLPTLPETSRRRGDLDAIDRLMRERVGLAPAPVPVPLHKMAAAMTPKTSAGSPPAAAPTEE